MVLYYCYLVVKKASVLIAMISYHAKKKNGRDTNNFYCGKAHSKPMQQPFYYLVIIIIVYIIAENVHQSMTFSVWGCLESNVKPPA